MLHRNLNYWTETKWRTLCIYRWTYGHGGREKKCCVLFNPKIKTKFHITFQLKLNWNKYIFLFLVLAIRPEYSWKIARWTLNTNQSINHVLGIFYKGHILTWCNIIHSFTAWLFLQSGIFKQGCSPVTWQVCLPTDGNFHCNQILSLTFQIIYIVPIYKIKNTGMWEKIIQTKCKS